MRAALDWAMSNEPERGLALAAAPEGFWLVREPMEGTSWLEPLLVAATGAEPKLRGHALRALGGVLQAIEAYERAALAYGQSLGRRTGRPALGCYRGQRDLQVRPRVGGQPQGVRSSRSACGWAAICPGANRGPPAVNRRSGRPRLPPAGLTRVAEHPTTRREGVWHRYLCLEPPASSGVMPEHWPRRAGTNSPRHRRSPWCRGRGGGRTVVSFSRRPKK